MQMRVYLAPFNLAPTKWYRLWHFQKKFPRASSVYFDMSTPFLIQSSAKFMVLVRGFTVAAEDMLCLG